MTNIVPFTEMRAMAEAVARSGLFGMKTPEQALALMLVAQAEGQHPASVTQDYDIIQGRAVRKTHSVLARFQSAGGRVEWHRLNDEVADATFSHPAGGSLRLQWTIEQARRIGLAGKDNWKNYPRAMLRARVIAEGVRAVWPAAIGGMLVAEEAADIEPAHGARATVIDAQTQADKQSLPAPQEEALPEYPADRFEQNMPKWRDLIAAGKKTADEIIAMLSSKARLTDEQVSTIRALGAAPASDAEAWVADYDAAEAK